MEMTISINPAQEEQLSRLASIIQSDKGELLEELISSALAEKFEKVAAIQEGLDDLAHGRTLSTAEVIAKAQAAIRRGAARKS